MDKTLPFDIDSLQQQHQINISEYKLSVETKQKVIIILSIYFICLFIVIYVKNLFFVKISFNAVFFV